MEVTLKKKRGKEEKENKSGKNKIYWEDSCSVFGFSTFGNSMRVSVWTPTALTWYQFRAPKQGKYLRSDSFCAELKVADLFTFKFHKTSEGSQPLNRFIFLVVYCFFSYVLHYGRLNLIWPLCVFVNPTSSLIYVT